MQYKCKRCCNFQVYIFFCFFFVFVLVIIFFEVTVLKELQSVCKNNLTINAISAS